MERGHVELDEGERGVSSISHDRYNGSAAQPPTTSAKDAVRGATPAALPADVSASTDAHSSDADVSHAMQDIEAMFAAFHQDVALTRARGVGVECARTSRAWLRRLRQDAR